jgi:hypothetical protein
MGRIVWIFFAVLLFIAAGVRADTTMEVRYGWGEYFSPGRWTPVYVTLSDPSPRNVLLELRTPTDSGVAMRIRQGVAIGPEPSTYLLLAPLTYDLSETVVTARDLDKRKLLAEEFLHDPENFSTDSVTRVQSEQPFIGVSGRGPALKLVEREDFGAQRPVVGFLETSLLPAAAEGYTSLDLLVLTWAHWALRQKHLPRSACRHGSASLKTAS